MNPDEQQSAWSGSERRSIPIHILNHIDHKLDEHIHEVNSVIKNHTTDEMDRYTEILDNLNTHIEQSGKRHEVLQQSVMSYMEKMDNFYDSVIQAFPKDEYGKPDFKGHGRAHIVWQEGAEKEKHLLAYIEQQIAKEQERSGDITHIKRGVFTAILVVLVMWAGSTLLQSSIQTYVNKPPITQSIQK